MEDGRGRSEIEAGFAEVKNCLGNLVTESFNLNHGGQVAAERLVLLWDVVRREAGGNCEGTGAAGRHRKFMKPYIAEGNGLTATGRSLLRLPTTIAPSWIRAKPSGP